MASNGATNLKLCFCAFYPFSTCNALISWQTSWSNCIGYLYLEMFALIINISCSQIHVMLFATTAYVVCLVGIILMFIWYAPKPSCLLNIFFIAWTLVLLQLMTSVSLHPKVSSIFVARSLLAQFTSSYIRTWSGISSSAIGECWHSNSRAYGALCCLPLLERY